MNRKIPHKLSISHLALLTGHNREEIRKWMVDENCYKDGVFLKSEEECLAVISKHETYRNNGSLNRNSDAKSANTEPDDETGLPWKEALEREKTIELRRLNRIAERTESGDYMPAATHKERVSILTGKLEQIPDKARSELGLSDTQTSKLTKMLDDCRQEAVNETKEKEVSESKAV